jgi:Trp operon repressor
MELTSTRKRANAITSNIFNRIAIRGQRNIASQLGVDESQITRWKSSFPAKRSDKPFTSYIFVYFVLDKSLLNH